MPEKSHARSPAVALGFRMFGGAVMVTVGEALENAQRQLEAAEDEIDLVKQGANIALGNAWTDLGSAILEMSRA